MKEWISTNYEWWRLIQQEYQSTIQQEIDQLFGLDKKWFSTQQQPSLLTCGPVNILNTLRFFNDLESVELPTLEQLKKETRMISINDKDKVWTLAFRYNATLNKHLRKKWYKSSINNNISYTDIRKSINDWIPVWCLMMVPSKKNPARVWWDVSDDQYGYHYQTIIGIWEDDSIRLSNPFGYEEIVTREEFEKRRSLDDSLLNKRDRLIKKLGLAQPYTTFIIEELPSVKQ